MSYQNTWLSLECQEFFHIVQHVRHHKEPLLVASISRENVEEVDPQNVRTQRLIDVLWVSLLNILSRDAGHEQRLLVVADMLHDGATS